MQQYSGARYQEGDRALGEEAQADAGGRYTQGPSIPILHKEIRVQGRARQQGIEQCIGRRDAADHHGTERAGEGQNRQSATALIGDSHNKRPDQPRPNHTRQGRGQANRKRCCAKRLYR